MARTNKLDLWTTRYETCRTNINRDIYKEMYKQYKGTKAVRGDVNNQNANITVKLANNVRQVSYEMVESQVNTIIPDPLVRSKRNGFQDLARNVQDKIKADLETSTIPSLNDRIERLVPIYGWCMVIMDWDISKGSHEYKGDKSFEVVSPSQVIPQSGIYDFKKMDYFFIEVPTTKNFIKLKYGIDVFDEEESNPELTKLQDDTIYTQNGVTDDNVTLVKVYYKDEQGDVGVYMFVNDVEIADYPKYYYPKLYICENCGTINPQGTKKCVNCGEKKFKTADDEYDEIQEEIELEPLVATVTKKTADYNDEGIMEVRVEEVEAITKRVLEEGDKVPRYIFKDYPIVVRVNTPDEYKIGQSDLEVIADQHVALSKIVSRIQEKLMKGGTIIACSPDTRARITDELYQVITMKTGDLQTFRTIDLQADVTRDIEAARFYYEMIQSTLGISDSFQGKYDPSAKSGRAKEVQVQQSAGRLSSKMLNKYVFFKDLFNLMFKFDLCFTNESRYFVKKNADNNDEWAEFSKLNFLVRDKNDNWYYNDEFIITAESGNALPNDKVFIMEQTVAQFSAGLLDRKQYWQILKSLNFPNASDILSQLEKQEEEIAQQEQAMQEQAMLQGQAEPPMPPMEGQPV